MKKDVNNTPVERMHDGYDFCRDLVSKSLDNYKGNWLIFNVGGHGLFEAYLANMPEKARQHYTCHACHRFMSVSGGFVAINTVSLEKKAVWWDQGDKTPEFFKKSFDAMKNLVLSKPIVKAVRFTDTTLGFPITGAWTHFYGKVPGAFVSNSIGERQAQDITVGHDLLANAITEFTKEQVTAAVNFLSGNIYRASEVLPHAKWLQEVFTFVETHPSKKEEFLWVKAHRNSGFCHIKSGMLGVVLAGIKEGQSEMVLKASFEEKMRPENYHRSQSAPTVSAIENAEKKVMELGLVDSLRRKYLSVDDVKEHFIWTPRVTSKQEETGGVFDSVKKVAKTVKPIDPNKAKDKMTWAKFTRDLLPNVTNIRVAVNGSRKMSLIGPAVPGSRNIIKWENGITWTYNNGVDGTMRDRVLKAGGRFDDVPFRATLSWDSYTDLDLHCVTPKNEHIYYGAKRGYYTKGFLDVDANGGVATTVTPVENIVFDTIPDGTWKFFVHNYCDRNRNNNPFRAELFVNGHVWHIASKLTNTGAKQDLFTIKTEGGAVTEIILGKGETEETLEGTFPNVVGILPSPNTWDGNGSSQKHIFFILEGATAPDGGRGFYNEFIIPELQDIRKVLEIFAGQSEVENKEESTASGVGYVLDQDWNLELFVDTNNGQRHILIDRYE